jgi:hypothetical protein
MGGRHKFSEADMTISQTILIVIGLLYILHVVADIYGW